MVEGSSRPPAADPLIGRVLAGAYRLEALLGKGAMGAVYRARHDLLGQEFAVKVLHPELADDEDVRRRFLQEAHALTRFTHKNAVPVRHCGEEQGLVFLAMDLCRGETLESVLAREGALPEPRAIAITRQVLAALEEAHRAGIVHRDLKPANVMVEPGRAGGPEVARVLDFGLSRVLAEGRDPAASRVSALGEIVGTVAYMSPEQALGEDIDGRSDLFSLGVLLFELVEGRHPFLGGTMASVVTRLLEVERLLADPIVPRRASPGLQRVLGHALQRDRAQRFPDAAAFAGALADLEAGREIPAPPDPVGAARRRARVRRLALAALGALAAGAAAWAGAALLGSAPGSAAALDRPVAERALAEGRWQDAVAAWAPIAALPDASGTDHLALGEARIGAEDPDAERDLAVAQRLLPGDPRVEVALGRFFHRVRRDPARAKNAFDGAVARDRRHPAARLARLELLLDPAQRAWFDGRREDPLALARADLAAIETAGASAADVALWRSRIAEAEAERPGADAAALLAAAEAAAAQAIAAEPGWAAGWEQRARVRITQSGAARLASRHDESLRRAREAVADAVEARRRVEAEPGRRAQGAWRLPLLRFCLGLRSHAWDWDGLAEDARTLARLAPGEIDALRQTALALRTAGRFEEALGLYESLSEVAPDGPTLGDLAFCRQRLGVGLLLEGQRALGLEALERSVRGYEEAVRLAPRSPVYLAYRGETLGLLARWDPAGPRHAERLAAAHADLDRAVGLCTGPADEQEVLFRRAGLRLFEGDPEGARADMARIVDGRPDLSPSFHGRYARCLLALAARAAEASDAPTAFARTQEALEQARRAEERSGDQKGAALVLGAQIRLFGSTAPGSLEPDDSAVSLAIAPVLERALAPGALPTSEAADEARLWLALARALVQADDAPARAAARSAWRLRRAELARGRESASPAVYEALGRLPGDGDPETRAARAAGIAARVPP